MLVSGLVIITGAFLYFLRSQRNRDIAAEALAGNDSKVGAVPNGALPDLIGVAVFGAIVMGLLAGGYASKGSAETAGVAGPVGGGGGMAQPAGLADQPKKFQPANPAPDLRTAPASSPAGAGPDNGGRPENAPK